MAPPISEATSRIALCDGENCHVPGVEEIELEKDYLGITVRRIKCSGARLFERRKAFFERSRKRGFVS
jgi:hypothetical protein